MAVNEKGYIRPTYDELLAARFQLARELFGDDIDTSNSSPLGKFIRLSVQDLADAYEGQEIIYYARFPHTATGQSLDRLMPFAGITRNPATRAEHSIKFTGTANHTIAVGFLVGTTGEEEFYLANPVVLDESGTGTGMVQCTEFGTVGNVQLGAITEIINPDSNVLSIEHVNIELLAEDEETDAELRERFEIAIEGSGSGTAAAIRGAVMRVAGVNSCVVVENCTDEIDENGIPAHSFETFVFAPSTEDQDIANAIFSKKPLGIKAHGSTSATVIDISGGSNTVAFSRVTEKVVRIKITIATDASLELDAEEKIKTALLLYVNGLSAGEDVIYTRLYKDIFGIAGVRDVTTLTLSTDGTTYTIGNITVGQHEVATLNAENIAIEVTTYEDN